MRFWWTVLFYMSKIDQCCQNNLHGRLKVANEGWEVPDMATALRPSSKQTVSDLELAFRCRNTSMHDDLLQLCRSELVKPRVPKSCIDLSWYKWLKFASEPCRWRRSTRTERNGGSFSGWCQGVQLSLSSLPVGEVKFKKTQLVKHTHRRRRITPQGTENGVEQMVSKAHQSASGRITMHQLCFALRKLFLQKRHAYTCICSCIFGPAGPECGPAI